MINSYIKDNKKMISRTNSGKIELKFLFYLISIMASLYIFFRAGPSIYIYTTFFPLIYAILVLLCPNLLRIYNNSLSMWFFNIICFVRYISIPVIFAAANFDSYYLFNPDENEIVYAIILMIYEEIVIMLVYNYFIGRYVKRDKSIRIEPRLAAGGVNLIVLTGLIILVIIGMIIFPNLRSYYHFIFIEANYIEPERSSAIISVFFLLLEWLKVIFPIVIISFIYMKYKITGWKRYVIYSCVVVLISLLFIKGSNRGSIFLPAIVYLFVLRDLYDKYKKSLTIALSGGIISVVVITTIWKSFLRWGIEAEPLLSLKWMSDQLQLYFGSVDSIAMSVRTSEIFQDSIRITTFFNSILWSLPGLNSLASYHDRMNVYYNYICYNVYGITDLIDPLTGTANAYLGPILAPIFPTIFLVIGIFFEKKSNETSLIEFKYLYRYAGLFVLTGIFGGITIITSFLITTFLPLHFILKVNRKVILKRGDKL